MDSKHAFHIGKLYQPIESGWALVTIDPETKSPLQYIGPPLGHSDLLVLLSGLDYVATWANDTQVATHTFDQKVLVVKVLTSRGYIGYIGIDLLQEYQQFQGVKLTKKP